jgi:hypothetical protein
VSRGSLLAGRARPRPALIVIAAALAAVALSVAALLGGDGGRAAAAPAQEALPQTDASVPARLVTMIGATPEEPAAPGADETWGIGLEGTTPALVRYASGNGWTLGPALPAGFTPAPGPLAGAMTPKGEGLLAGTVKQGSTSSDALLVREPGGAFTAAPAPVAEGGTALLAEGESLYGELDRRTPLIAALDEGGRTGALLAPTFVKQGVEHQVLHWDGSTWSSEPIALPAATAGEFRVLAIAAESPANAWLLGELSSSGYPSGSVALFRRIEAGGKWSWKPVALTAGAGDGEAHPLSVPTNKGTQAPFSVAGLGSPPSVRAQLLTVTAEGLWIDGERTDVHTATPDSTSLFFKPEGSLGGHLDGSWCVTPPGEIAACDYELGRPLPAPYDRSFAWADGSRYGQRVITGFAGGRSMRLAGSTFTELLALGGGTTPDETPGAEHGSAFSSPSEGWLGVGGPPVHLTTARAGTHLRSWPVPFRHPLLAVAPQPGVPIASLTSEALAVGDQGAVARYEPTVGWVPESLFGPGQRLEKPRLRAVAWPTPSRAYAVGESGHEIGEQMWLWRSETKLWEHDPAAPINFTGNLYGIAFDPANPTRGYAVGTTSIGTGGVLLRYGKSWQPETSLPPEVAHAAFTGIAFAGSDAIVAYRVQPDVTRNEFVGGLIENEGSGWHVDSEAATLMAGSVPIAIAGLPDGGAAVETSGGSAGGLRVYERQSTGAAWTPTPEPLPGSSQGSLSLFREGGALRAVVAGGGGVASSLPPQAPAPGFPEELRPPLGPVAGEEGGGLLRQTGNGWSDERHELDPVGTTAGGYIRQDVPYQPDSVFATLIDPGSGQGWAVGGDLNEEATAETGDVERYEGSPGEAGAPPGETEDLSALRREAAESPTIAVGGHAACAAACGERSLASVGPQVWLSHAVALARAIGVPFVYTGPSVTPGEITGTRSHPIPFSEEFADTQALLETPPPGWRGEPLASTFAAASPADLDARPEREGSEGSFMAAFAGHEPQAELMSRNNAGCAPATSGCQTAYYSFESGGAAVIVLDDTTDPGAKQVEWLEEQLSAAEGANRPALVIGAADLPAQVAAGDGPAIRLAGILNRPKAGASAYLFDSPEEDVEEHLTPGAESIMAFGSGTLGYVLARNERAGNFHGASGILLVKVVPGTYNTGENLEKHRATVKARLIPVVGELALEAKDGILLRRSQPALFAGLARRPRAGCVAEANSGECLTDPYIPLPEICVGQCTTALAPEYSFSSSNESIARFVEHNTGSSDPHAVVQNAAGEPVFERGAAHSGLLCALNPGETKITISAGGRSATLGVRVQAGSVRQPCGTVLAEKPPATEQHLEAPPPTQPSPTSATPAASPPPIVPLPAPPAVPAAVAPPARPVAPRPPPFVPLSAAGSPVLAFVPPPVPSPARPSPPTGTSAVTSPIEVAEKEEEQEEATESVSNQAVAYRAPDEGEEPLYLIGMLVIAAAAGVAIRRRPRRTRRGAEIAPATVVSAERQRRMSRDVR